MAAVYLGTETTHMKNRSHGKMHANKIAAGERHPRLLGVEGYCLGMSKEETADIVYTIVVRHRLFLLARLLGPVIR
jgi:hypothetical protein